MNEGSSLGPPPQGSGYGSGWARPADSAIGRAIGPYRLESELGRGSFGVVYLARPLTGGDPVALKVLLDLRHPDELARFLREGELAARLDHPAIVRVRDRGSLQGRPWLALDYCPGETLRQRLQRGALEVDAARALIDRIAAAIEYAHGQGVIHRDLKPANVLLDLQGRPHVTDFGLARDAGGAGLTRSGDGLGSPLYMPPEQFSDAKHVDARADVYALGLLLYEALTARQPFEGSTVVEISQAIQAGSYVPLRSRRPQVPEWLARVSERAFARDRDERFPDARAFRAALAAGDPAAPVRSRARRAPSAVAPRSAAPLVLAGVAVGLALTGLGVGVWTLRARGLAARAELEQAQAYLAAGDLAAARAAYAQAQRGGLEAPDVAQALGAGERLEQAEAALQAGDVGPARQLARAELPPGLDARRAALELAVLAHDAELRDPAARAEALRALRAAPPATRDVLAGRLLREGRARSRAKASLEEVLELLDPAAQVAATPALRDEVALEVASVHWRRGRLERSRELAQRLREREGRLGFQARYVAAYALVWQDALQGEGLEELRQLAQDDPDGPVGLNANAVYHSHSGKNAEGERFATRALDLDPDYVDAYISLAFCRNDQFFLGQDASFLAGSLEASAEAVARMPDHPRAYLARAYALGNRRVGGESVAAYDEVIALTEPRPMARALRNRAQHCFATGDRASAIEGYRRVLSLYPRDGEAYLALGLIYDQLERHEEALAVWRRGIEAAPREVNLALRRLAVRAPPVAERIARALR